MNRKIIIAAAGTGGHVFPGLAVAEVLQKEHVDVSWIGCHERERSWVAKASSQITFHQLNFAGVRGKGLKRWLSAPWHLYKAFIQAKAILRAEQPYSVLLMGGYVSVPVGLAAKFLGIPFYVHEQNSIPGLANKILSKMATQVRQGFTNALPHATHTGNPVRQNMCDAPSIEARYADQADQNAPHVRPLKLLVLGGSLGAQAINKVVPEAIARMSLAQRPTVVHQTGSQHLQSVQNLYAKLGVDAHVTDFIHHMHEAYAWADLLICRAGAMTIAELCTVGVPAIFVPYPHAVDDHQTANVHHLLQSKAAWCIPQATLNAEMLAELLRGIDLDELKQMAYKAKMHSHEQAADKVAHLCMGLVKE